MAVQLRRGDYEDFDPQKMKPAEVGVVQHNDPNTSDGKAVYVAINPGDVKRLVSDIEVQDVIYNETEEIINQIEQGVADTVAQVEAWVTGEVDGEPVPTTDPAYHNNAKWYAEQAAASAETLVTDDTLSHAGQAADAKATGDAIAGLEDEIAQIVPGLSSEAKEALLTCFQHVLWSSEDGSEYYEALEEALNPPKTLLSIVATYISAGHTVYPYDTLNSLKEYITVTADYSDGTQGTVDVDECTLSGDLDSSTSIITVTYQNKTAQVNVSVTIDSDLAYYVTRGTELNGVDSGFNTEYVPSDTNKAVTIVGDFTDTSIVDKARSMSVIYNANNSSGYAALVISSASGSDFVKQYAINAHGAGSRKLENLTNASHRMRFAYTHAANSNYVYGNLYVDNTVVCENVEMSANYRTDSTPLYVGKRPSGGYLSEGVINLFNIYNRVLTQSEIKSLLKVN